MVWRIFWISSVRRFSRSAQFSASTRTLVTMRSRSISACLDMLRASVGMTVSRAIVRDQFTGTEAARIMNMIGMMLAIGPAVSPTLGGFALGLFGWQSIFFLMVGFALAACGAVYFCMLETTTPDPAKGRIGPILRGYGALATSPRFVSATLVMAGGRPALYRPATALPLGL